jgi:hypothetical protein
MVSRPIILPVVLLGVCAFLVLPVFIGSVLFAWVFGGASLNVGLGVFLAIACVDPASWGAVS